MAFLWREHVKRITTPHQRHLLVMLREHIVGPFTRITAGVRALPDFIIIGASRSGTTHFFNTLRHHPQIKTSRIKEVKFFNNDEKYNKGESFYRSYFPLRTSLKKGDIVGEASPNYLSTPKSADRIKQMLPDAKLIVLLRDPVQRFLSCYFYKQQKEHQKHIKYPTLEEMLSDENIDQTIKEEVTFYIDEIKRYEKYYKSGNLLIINSDDYFSSPEVTLQQVCNYLGVDDSYNFPKLKSWNKAMLRTSVSDEVIEKLTKVFAQKNELLYKYINKDLDW